jgi:hypothetical protein
MYIVGEKVRSTKRKAKEVRVTSQREDKRDTVFISM